MGKSMYQFQQCNGNCELSVQKLFSNFHFHKTIVYSFKAFTGKLFRLCP